MIIIGCGPPQSPEADADDNRAAQADSLTGTFGLADVDDRFHLCTRVTAR
jgi:hypothetical protein